MATCTQTANVLHIIKGSDREFTLRVIIEETCEPFDLTGVSEIRALFKKTDDTALVKTMTSGAITVMGSPSNGKIKVLLGDADTTLLKVGEEQAFEIEIQIGTITSIVQFLASITVVDRIFP